MRKFDLHFPEELLAQKEILLFFRPTKAKLLRVASLPTEHENNTELIQVLNTLCKRRVKDIWFFQIDNDEEMLEISHALYFMNIEHVIAEPEISQKLLVSPSVMRISNN